MPVLEQAKVRYEREKERQADRDGLIGTVTRMEENLKTYDRFDSLQENLKACRKETESLEKRLELSLIHISSHIHRGSGVFRPPGPAHRPSHGPAYASLPAGSPGRCV